MLKYDNEHKRVDIAFDMMDMVIGFIVGIGVGYLLTMLLQQ